MVVYRPRPGLYDGSPSGGSSEIGATPDGAYKAGTYRPALRPWHGTNYGDYNLNSSETLLPPIPLEWIIAPYGNGKPDCPSANATLGVFAATYLIPVLFLTVFGRRTIVNRLTMGKLGKKGGKGIYFTWLLGLTINLFGNLFAMMVVTGTDGYEHLRKSTVFALYASRPSFTMTFMALLRILVFRRSDGEASGEYVYVDSYISSAVGELILQTIAAVFIGVTWKRFPNQPIKEYMGGALVYMQVLPAITLICMIVVPFWHRDPRPRKTPMRWLYALVAMWCFVAVVTASWVYWTQFLSLPGSLWCPPKLLSQAAIWTVFSTLAGFVSA